MDDSTPKNAPQSEDKKSGTPMRLEAKAAGAVGLPLFTCPDIMADLLSIPSGAAFYLHFVGGLLVLRFIVAYGLKCRP
jgi:hypothetical protein